MSKGVNRYVDAARTWAGLQVQAASTTLYLSTGVSIQVNLSVGYVPHTAATVLRRTLNTVQVPIKKKSFAKKKD